MSSLSVSASGAAADAISRHVPVLVADGVAGKLFAQDATLWGPEAEAESRVRLSWVGLPRSSRPLVGEIEALRDDFASRGLTHVVLCGMGGSSLAPEVICATAGKDLVVLDSSDPDYVRRALGDDLEHTVVVVSSKSGSTVETDSQRRAYEGAFSDAGIDPATRIVIVTDPGSPLDEESRAKGYRVVNADPDVGGRYSALTAFGLVPSGLAGVDVGALLDEAESVADLLAEDDEANPALRLGAAMAGTDARCATSSCSSTRAPASSDSPTGPSSSSPSPPARTARACCPSSSRATTRPRCAPPPPTCSWPGSCPVDDDTVASGDDVRVSGALGAQLLLWEAATAVAGRLLAINPFDQPDVESAKKAARALLDQGTAASEEPAATDGAVEIRAMGGDWLGSAIDRLRGARRAARPARPASAATSRSWPTSTGSATPSLADVRASVAERTGRPTTFGWGPRFLHSTGQFHKGGPAVGVYVQITTAPGQDLPIPGREFTFGDFIASQAGGDAQVLADHDRPVLRLHLTDHDAGLAQVTAALSQGGRG